MIELQSGLVYHPGYFDRPAQETLLQAIRTVVQRAPLFTPRMPRTGQPFSVRMSNCGVLGWVSDEMGYRYQESHPETGENWPEMPDILLDTWRCLCPAAPLPEACLINLYGRDAKMGLHQDRDERDLSAPVLSISLGAAALFRFGGDSRRDPTRSIRLESGDVVVIGGKSRLCFHGIDRLYAGTSTLIEGDRRINLTMRRVCADS